MFDMMAQWFILYLRIIRKVLKGSWAKDRTWDKSRGQWLMIVNDKKKMKMDKQIKVIVG